MGKMVMQISCGFAEMERGLIRERTKAGLARAGANGKHLGRRRAVTKDKAQLAQSMRAGGTLAQIQSALGLTRSTLRTILSLDLDSVGPDAWAKS